MTNYEEKLLYEDAIRGARGLLKYAKQRYKEVPSKENERMVASMRHRLSRYAQELQHLRERGN